MAPSPCADPSPAPPADPPLARLEEALAARQQAVLAMARLQARPDVPEWVAAGTHEFLRAAVALSHEALGSFEAARRGDGPDSSPQRLPLVA